ncbi:jg8990 [Pararge aegeria aegeria]|uniref:Jg8990 protein n=1 Tax=Pararge aegeria aegeria TaxID=348720 RepID=A0A8S4SHS3_9NEOP|nr:jg8990 [Pararge aegeria aegeria]
MRVQYSADHYNWGPSGSVGEATQLGALAFCMSSNPIVTLLMKTFCDCINSQLQFTAGLNTFPNGRITTLGRQVGDRSVAYIMYLLISDVFLKKEDKIKKLKSVGLLLLI